MAVLRQLRAGLRLGAALFVRRTSYTFVTLGSVDINLDGRDAGPLPAAQGAVSEVYRVYMSERRCGDAGKGPSPRGYA
jgi:hypothetical protein